MAENKFLGTGCKFPVEIDPATGRFMTVSGDRSVKESIYLILMTQRTERLVRPSFGSDIMNYTFMDTGTTMMSILRRNITQTIMDQEPRVADLDVTTEYRDKQGVIYINLEYLVRDTNTRDNMVFPFYLDNGTKEMNENEEGDLIAEGYEGEYNDLEESGS